MGAAPVTAQPRPPGPGGRTKSGKPRPAPAARDGTGSRARGRPRRRTCARGTRRSAAPRRRPVAPGPAARGGGRATEPGWGGWWPGSRSAAKTTGERRGEASGGRQRGAGDAPEVVAGRNAVVEALRAGVPAAALYAGPRRYADERVREAVDLAAAAGIPMIEAGRAEL